MAPRRIRYCWAALLFLAWGGCQADPPETPAEKPSVPHGYVRQLEVQVDDRIFSFGPFVGYYFKPARNGDLTRLHFICFNERSFYTRDLPPNARLFEGEAQWRQLADNGHPIPAAEGRRIVPVFFPDAPDEWVDSRPNPKDAYLHFHSAYDGGGAVRYGYWLRHVALDAFTYDMGGRVTSDSPLYHAVRPGPDTGFARIIEFDHGP